MMKVGLLIFSLMIIAVGCRNADKIPNDLLPEKKMQAVLWDIMRADQFLSDYVLNKDTSLNKITERLKYYQQIFTIHKISKEKFQKSFSFYSTRPELLKAIMDSIASPPKVEITSIIEPDSAITTPVLVEDSITQPVEVILQDTPLVRKRKISVN